MRNIRFSPCSLNVTTLLLFIVIFFPQIGKCSSLKTYFPEFSCIKDNVRFWEKVYEEYSTNTAVLHDREDLGIIYEAVPLLDNALPGAAKLNQAHLKAVRKKYETLLDNLARGVKPASAEEKRVLALFSPPELRRAKLKKASQNLRFQTGLKERFLEGVVRSGAYIGQMKEIFRSYGLPEDLAYLPHVESSFNIQAYSKFGAAGVWQFTHATGMNYMTIDYIVDERRDPIIATHGAAKYLKSNFANLTTWPLAITAYNYGHAGMLRAVKQEGTYENIFRNYREGYFKFAARNFYSEFLAALKVAKKLEQLPDIKMQQQDKLHYLTLPGYASAAELANHLGISRSEMRRYNPSLRNPVWQEEKYIPQGFKLALPHSPETVRLAAAIPNAILKDSQRRSQFYRVQKGDTAGGIAKRFGISLASLSKTNNLNRNAVVFIGQNLQIPSSAKISQATIQSVSTVARTTTSGGLVILQDNKKTSPTWKVSLSEQIASNNDLDVKRTVTKEGIIHGEIIVLPEESLALYAEWLRINKEKIYAFNKISAGSSIHPGQQLMVPFIFITKDDFETRRKEYHKEAEEDFFSSYKITGVRQYKVASGDTLWDICQNKFGLPLWLLKRYNNDLNYSGLSSNQHLHIPIIESL